MSSHQYGYDCHAFLYGQRPSQTNCEADSHTLYRCSACTGAPGSRRFWALTWAKENPRHSSSAPSVPGLALSTPIRSLQSQSPETHNGGSCSISSPRGLKLAHVSLISMKVTQLHHELPITSHVSVIVSFLPKSSGLLRGSLASQALGQRQFQVVDCGSQPGPPGHPGYGCLISPYPTIFVEVRNFL